MSLGTLAENEVVGSPFQKIKYDLAQNIFKDVTLPSLKNKSLIRIARSLWHKEDVLNLIENSSYGLNNLRLTDLPSFDNVLEKISYLPIPQCFQYELKELTNDVGEQLFSFIYFMSKYHYCTPSEFSIYWKNICWTEKGTINLIKTVSSIIENTDLPVFEKYHLACDNCLEKYMWNLHERLAMSNDFIRNLNKKNNTLLVLFWTYSMRGEHEKFSRILERDILIFWHLLEWSILHNLGCAVQYIWENHADELVKESVVHFAIHALKMSKQNIAFYFLSVMNESQVKEVFNDPYNMSELLNLPKIRRFLLNDTIRYVENILNNIRKNNAIQFIDWCWEKIDNEHYLCILNSFLNFVNDLSECEFRSICNATLSVVLSLENYDIFNLILSKASFDTKRQYLYSSPSVYKLFYVEKLKCHQPDNFLKEMLNYREDEIDKFKRFLKKDFKERISLALILKHEGIIPYESIEMFYGKDLDGFKRDLLCDNDGHFIIRLLEKLPYNNVKEVEMLERFLDWSFDDDKKRILNYKKYVFSFTKNFNRFYDRIYLIINTGNVQVAESYLVWAFCLKDKNSNVSKVKIVEKFYIRYRDNVIIFYTRRESFEKFAKYFLTHKEFDRFITNMGLKGSDPSIIKYPPRNPNPVFSNPSTR